MKQAFVLCLSGLSLAIFDIAQYSSRTSFLYDNSHAAIADKSISNRTPTIQLEGRGNPWINFRNGLDPIFSYTGNPDARHIVENGQATPKAMASADF